MLLLALASEFRGRWLGSAMLTELEKRAIAIRALDPAFLLHGRVDYVIPVGSAIDTVSTAPCIVKCRRDARITGN